MNAYFVGILLLAGIFLGIILFQMWVRKRTFKIAADWSKRTYPVWAALGPFESGTDSAIAMANVLIVTMGVDFARDSRSLLETHKKAYDSNPEEWEERRLWTLERFDQTAFSDAIAAAKRLREEMKSEDEDEVVLSVVLEATLSGRHDRMVDFVVNKPPSSERI